ncbi:MAG: hypothetical protein KAR84_01570, partial [Elusimicrobiales bacterium]|nr:hypothetical protein [Elusimicrobiales bacterium]
MMEIIGITFKVVLFFVFLIIFIAIANSKIFKRKKKSASKLMLMKLCEKINPIILDNKKTDLILKQTFKQSEIKLVQNEIILARFGIVLALAWTKYNDNDAETITSILGTEMELLGYIFNSTTQKRMVIYENHIVQNKIHSAICNYLNINEEETISRNPDCNRLISVEFENFKNKIIQTLDKKIENNNSIGEQTEQAIIWMKQSASPKDLQEMSAIKFLALTEGKHPNLAFCDGLMTVYKIYNGNPEEQKQSQ